MGLVRKSGKSYDAYLFPDGTEEYRYTKDGKKSRMISVIVILC